MTVDPDEFYLIVNTWAAQQAVRFPRLRCDPTPQDWSSGTNPRSRTQSLRTTPTTVTTTLMVVEEPVRGRTWSGQRLKVRQSGARRPDGTRVQLLAALRHDTRMVIGQRNGDNDKTNAGPCLPRCSNHSTSQAGSSPQMRCTPSERPLGSSLAMVATTSPV